MPTLARGSLFRLQVAGRGPRKRECLHTRQSVTSQLKLPYPSQAWMHCAPLAGWGYLRVSQARLITTCVVGTLLLGIQGAGRLKSDGCILRIIRVFVLAAQAILSWITAPHPRTNSAYISRSQHRDRSSLDLTRHAQIHFGNRASKRGGDL